MFAFVVVMAAFLWVSDKSLEVRLLYDLIFGLEEIVMTMRWYVIHAYSGFEKSVQRALLDRISRAGMEDEVRTNSGPDRRGCGDEIRPEKYFRAQVFPRLRLD